MSRSRHGFTLIELLIVIVIIGLLAVFAVPKYANAKDRATIAGVRSDLRNLVSAQESHLVDYQTYASAIGTSASAGTVAFEPTNGTAITIGTVTATGWSATATSASIGMSVTCGVYVGTASPPAGMPADALESTVRCW